MLGAFSGSTPGPTTSSTVKQYHVADEPEPTVDVLTLGINGVRFQRVRSWERRAEFSIAMFPGPEDHDEDPRLLEWIVSRVGDCGPHKVTAIREDVEPRSEGEWNPGEICVREDLDCDPECPIEDPDPFERYWCVEPPACEL